MGEKNKKNKNEGEKQDGGGKNNGNGNSNITVVLKTDLHCDGCATKVLKCIRSFDGVEAASIDEKQKITVVGKLDPAKLREKLEQKTHKKIELISPQPKKGNDNNNKNGGDDKENAAKGKANDNNNDKNKQEKKKENKDKNGKDEAKSDEKKSKAKEPPVTTAVFKVKLHCEGCIQKIYKIVTKTKGYEDMKIDKQKELVTVTGAIDMKALAELLKKSLKKEVEIVPPKKDGEKKENGGGGNGGGEKGKGGGGKGKGGGGGDSGEVGNGGGDMMEANRMQFQVGYPYPNANPNPFFHGPGFVGDPQFHYNPYPVAPYHAPQIFSDENPNACSVM